MQDMDGMQGYIDEDGNMVYVDGDMMGSDGDMDDYGHEGGDVSLITRSYTNISTYTT